MLAKNTLAQYFRIYNDLVAFAAPNIRTKSHAHHAIEFILSGDSEMTLIHQDKEYKGKGIIINADVFHQTYDGGVVLFIYFDPESTFARQLNIVLKEKGFLILDDQLASDIGTFIANGIREHFSELKILNYLIEQLPFNRIVHRLDLQVDDRIVNVMSFIEKNMEECIVMKRLTAEACLSDSRLFHLFKKEIGIPIRKYILWCRIRKAIQLVLNGLSLTKAAQQAGFSDIAHLNRTFVYFFGISPSHVLKHYNELRAIPYFITIR